MNDTHTHPILIDWQWTKQEATIGDFIHVDSNFFIMSYICSITFERLSFIFIQKSNSIKQHDDDDDGCWGMQWMRVI